ncbi:hypothetical protein BAE44_0012288 [Dichanthelium oligosanthes]|uniref:DUF1618 domain-containing protein n=1 Tax=Dichanthelium oligosanthes TaxID=888268 RepID=A0A1E5VNI1_9POAL|nr:hypothetical protein BAE44_0012288 [Dichanthelium oligosanthes]
MSASYTAAGAASPASTCLVVVPQRQLHDPDRVGYNLHVFSTQTASWSTKAARLAPDMAAYPLLFHGKFHPTKVLAAVDGGGDSLAWVDIRRGILLCNSVTEDHPGQWRNQEINMRGAEQT